VIVVGSMVLGMMEHMFVGRMVRNQMAFASSLVVAVDSKIVVDIVVYIVVGKMEHIVVVVVEGSSTLLVVVVAVVDSTIVDIRLDSFVVDIVVDKLVELAFGRLEVEGWRL